jgi:DNA-directed RNA polymerase subunit alpha
VLNPTHQIATLDKKGPLSMELTVNVGRGYVSAERNKSPTMSIGRSRSMRCSRRSAR